MKVVITAHHFLPCYASGVELYTYRMARWLLSHGHTVHVVCVESIKEGDRTPRCVEDTYEGIPIYRLHFNLKSAPDHLQRQSWNPEIGSWFKQFLARVQPDVVHINSCYLLSASVVMSARELGIPIAISFHDFWFQCPRITLQRPDRSVCDSLDDPVECAWCLMTQKRRYLWLEMASNRIVGQMGKWLLRRSKIAGLLGWQQGLNTMQKRQDLLRGVLDQADVFIVATHFLKDTLLRQGYPGEKVRISPYGLDVSSWEPASATALDKRHLRIAYIGQVTPHKGIHILVQAFNRLSASILEPELSIYGNPQHFPRYAAQLQKLASGNPGITFAGTYDNKNTSRVFAGIDVLVIPSTWYECSPLVMLEALATGTPVIVSNSGGMTERIRHGVNGLVFESGNVEDLTKQLQRLLDNPGLLPKLRRGIKPVRTVDDEMAQLTEIYRSLGA